jgi:hypothetical protein
MRKNKADAALAAVLRAIETAHGQDHEAIHSDADKALVGTLRALGYNEAMDVYEDFTRWYA